MQKSQRTRTALLFLALIAFAVLLLHTLLTHGASVPAVQAHIEKLAPIEPSVSISVERQAVEIPVRIEIPSIGIHAAVEQVVLASDGSMGVPTHPLNAAWYALGPRPGEAGSAVIDGHINWFKGAAGVFADLRKVKPGDVIEVGDDAGGVMRFIVRESRIYGAAADTTSVFGSTDGKAHLNLITCDGTWNKITKQYSKRLVVFADKEEG